MTGIGAVAGAMAGLEVETRQRSATAYNTRVGMDDGSTRHFTVDTALAAGQKAWVQGDRLSTDASAAKWAPEPGAAVRRARPGPAGSD